MSVPSERRAGGASPAATARAGAGRAGGGRVATEPAGARGPAGVLGPVLVTGTDTGVGKTIVTAALAAAAGAAGLRVAVVKPAQTGAAGAARTEAGAGPVAGAGTGAADGARFDAGMGEETDEQTVVRLAAPAFARTLASYPDPLAPLTAARAAGLAALPLDATAAEIRSLAGSYDLVLVEGAGGLLVPMGLTGTGTEWTVADLAVAVGAAAVVVVRAGLGTLNHTALTLEALARRGTAALVVIGAWPAEPELVHRTNLLGLPGELAGVLPERAGMLAPVTFRASAASWLVPALRGGFDARSFRRAVAG